MTSTLQQLATNNVRVSWRRYLAYFLSCAFSVMVFYVFISFVLHPGLDAAFTLVNDTRPARAVVMFQPAIKQGLLICNGIIVIFSALFILYSNAAFLRSRSQEFGMLTLLGMTKGQMRRLVFIESMSIATVALGSGLLLGVFLSKLFFMSMGVLVGLEAPLAFAIPPLAVAVTALVYTLLFLTLTALTLFGLGRSNIVRLLRARRQPRPGVSFRPVLFVLSLALIGRGYYMAVNTTLNTMFDRMTPILVLVVLGTYLLYSQGVAGACGYLQSRPLVHWRGTNILTISKLAYRLKDNASILFISSILIAVVITGLGTVNTVVQNARQASIDEYPYALAFQDYEGPRQDADVLAIYQGVAQIIESRGHVITGKYVLPTTPTQVGFLGSDGVAQTRVPSTISNTYYNIVAKELPGLNPLELEPGEAAIILFNENNYYYLDNGHTNISVRDTEVGETVYNISLVHTQIRPITFGHNYLVVHDDLFAGLLATSSRYAVHYGFEYRGWEDDTEVDSLVASYLRQQALARPGSPEWFGHVSSRVHSYQSLKQGGGLIMFMGTFVSLLFFVACGSLLYFKLFTELQEDRVQYNTLRRIGLVRTELKQTVGRELGILFFMPWIIGSVHASFALYGMQLMLRQQGVHLAIIKAGLMVMCGYAALLYLYYLSTRRSYIHQLTLPQEG